MNSLRMIKLFGWENKTKAQVEEKREAELYWYKKKRILVLANLVTKCFSLSTYNWVKC